MVSDGGHLGGGPQEGVITLKVQFCVDTADARARTPAFTVRPPRSPVSPFPALQTDLNSYVALSALKALVASSQPEHSKESNPKGHF